MNKVRIGQSATKSMKYELNQLITGEYGNLYYFIPPEIVTKPIYGKLYSITPESGGYVYSRKFNWYLNQLGWTDREWYNVYILNIGRYDSPKCYCGNDLHRQGKVSWGYTQYCSLACSQADLANKPSFIKARSDYMHKQWTDEEYCKSRMDTNNSMKWLAGMSRWKMYYDAVAQGLTEAYFYYLVENDWMKIGASTCNPNARVNIYSHEYHKIYAGPLDKALDCEYDFKIIHRNELYASQDYGHTAYTEVFPRSMELILIDHINSYNLTLTDY